MPASREGRRREIHEHDASGNLTATYICSRNDAGDERLDIVRPVQSKQEALASRAWTWAFQAFLPAGYPESVGEDYLRYQIFDSLQAFASSIASLLSSRAALEGLGIGNSAATPQSALFLSIIQETASRIATILFAQRFGTAIEPECKMYRLLADVFNDVAMVLDCLSPAFPGGVRVAVLAGGSVLRALCGVAAGSAKGCLSAHFARRGNLGDVNAKDSSQETVLSLAGMLVGTFVVSHITSQTSTWSALMLLLAIHLAMNYAAARAVCMRSLNRQRATILLSNLMDGKQISPKDVANRERIFERDGVLRRSDGKKVGFCRIAGSMEEFARLMSQEQRTASSFTKLIVDFDAMLDVYEQERFLTWWDNRQRMATIVLKHDASTFDQLTAWMQAFIMATRAQTTDVGSLSSTLERSKALLAHHRETLEHSGFDLEVAALETRPGCRVSCENE